MKKKSICLVPEAKSLGGPRTFQQNLIHWASHSGDADIHFDADREDIPCLQSRFLEDVLPVRLVIWGKLHYHAASCVFGCELTAEYL